MPTVACAIMTGFHNGNDALFCAQIDAAKSEALIVDHHSEDSSGISSTASPGAHSPPFNTSSESGDSGVESGVYSFVGKRYVT